MSMNLRIGLSVIAAFILSFSLTPAVKWLAHRVGAIDVPKDDRRMHSIPIPRLGGLAIYIGFIVSVLLLADITRQIRGILLGSILIVAIGFIDDIKPLPALPKLIVQIMAAMIAVSHGVVIEAFSNPFVFSTSKYIFLNNLSIPITIFWIVGITNSVNFIDGLDGLAVGFSTICAISMLVISLMVSDPNIALIMAALTGASLGFIPYNFNPAKIFMGDTGALLLGFILANISVHGLFKFYAAISLVAPFLVLALPLFDTAFAFLRRLLKGQKPWTPDRGHLHHRLIDMGLNQRQAVGVLYAVSGISGIAAIIAAAIDNLGVLILMIVLIICVPIVFIISRGKLRVWAARRNNNTGKIDGIPATSKSGPTGNIEGRDEQ
ncbi:MAG: undecaprenyl/decaprenyl-phosphate alpha-N-acetylglucosaminyl 1-phosphate transferase [Oscillospiraceae bacterium]|nr:undecaprenyl/decaprenyl-phosphate alpha-N-acetylglucosaminyl 1-phosphate transferase [Oscillospiraceae bacterium]